MPLRTYPTDYLVLSILPFTRSILAPHTMSLGIMLRGLVGRDREQEKSAQATLEQAYKEEFRDLSKTKKVQMIAAQVVQDVQKKIWVDEISLGRLLSPEAGGIRLRTTPALLNRGAVDELAAKYISFPDGVNLDRLQLLGKRVLFGATISNVTPILADARKEFNADELGYLGLAEGMTSRLHREVRVFDLNFREIPEPELHNDPKYPWRWCRYHKGPEIRKYPYGIGSLLKPRMWAKMAATAVASGAFPIAFEPVVLERSLYEYGPALWPFSDNKKRHNFTFVDGGTFNNEPIREAFRLASFIDAHDPSDNFERCIVFVDPSVSSAELSCRVPVHQRMKLYDPNLFGSFDGYDLEELSSLDRLLPQIGSLVGAFMDEARAIEGDKVYQTRKRFVLRNGIREHLARALSSEPEARVLVDLAGYCTRQLKKNRDHMMIPVGGLAVEGELFRVIREERGELLIGLAGKSLQDIQDFVKLPGSSPRQEKGLWLRALAFVAVDLIMDLEGKQERNRLICIAPVLDPGKPDSAEDLPGGRISAFGGFMSEVPGEYEVRLARHCAKKFLEARGSGLSLIEPGPGGEQKPAWTKEKEQAYARDLAAGAKRLRDRIAELIASSRVPLVGAIPEGVWRLLLGWGLNRILEPGSDSTDYEFRVEVDSKDFELDGKGIADKDIRPVRVDGKLCLVTFASYTRTKGVPTAERWSGIHVPKGSRAIETCKDRLLALPDKRFCLIQLPNAADLAKADDLAYPVFTARLQGKDEGKRLSRDRWELRDGAVGLETKLLECMA